MLFILNKKALHLLSAKSIFSLKLLSVKAIYINNHSHGYTF